MPNEPSTEIKLRVSEALSKDVGRAFARMGPEDLQKLGVSVGDIVEIVGKRTTYCRSTVAYKEVRGQARVQLDGITRTNAKVGLDDFVTVRKRSCPTARQVHVAPMDVSLSAKDKRYVGALLDGLPVVADDQIRAALFGSRTASFKVLRTEPREPVVIHRTTELFIAETGKAEGEEEARAGEATVRSGLSYEDIGGLKPQLQRIREMIELPLRYPEVFARLGIDPPKGVLLHGPPGTGKTLIARTIAHETDAHFFSISGPEVIHKFYGESEAHLREIFEEAAKSSPSIVFVDEIDSIAASRERVVGEVEKRVVAQLLALMDGLTQRRRVIVIAATNIPNALDPALRRPGRFDREIAIPIPDRDGRKQILEIHSRGMPLGGDVNLEHLAEITHGFVGADLEALCREAAMSCLREILPEVDFSRDSVPYEQLSKLEVRSDHFKSALRAVEPSALREVFVDVPHVRWNDVGGLTDTKQRLTEAVQWPLQHAKLFEQARLKPPKGILLSGPPGCGKTLLAKAVATESGLNFISVKGAALLSKYVGESERGVRETFQKARQAAPCIIFFDELDALIPRRGGGGESHVSERVVSQFLTELDGIEDLTGVLVLAATNRSDIIDPAVLRPGRFDEIVEIPLPQRQDRAAILEVHLRGRPLEAAVDIGALAGETDGMSGADLAQLCDQAALLAIRRSVQGRDHEARISIGRGDIAAALAAASPAKERKREGG
jgi:transitional endoplasmic reticulum ATPase